APYAGEAVRAGQVAHRARLDRRAVEGDPRGDRVGLLDRPVGLVVVRIGLAAAGLLVERLVVPQAQAVGSDEGGRDRADARVEGERPHVRAVLPEVHALLEALLVERLLGERAPVVRHAARDARVDGRAVALELLVLEHALDDDEAVAAIALDQLGADVHAASRGSGAVYPGARPRARARARRRIRHARGSDASRGGAFRRAAAAARADARAPSPGARPARARAAAARAPRRRR